MESSVQQHEPLRQQYLTAMGITPWLPVRQLAGAAPSPAWRWTDADEPASQTAPAESASVSPPPVTAAPVPPPTRPDALRELLASDSSPVPKTEAPETRIAEVADSEAGSAESAPAPSVTAPGVQEVPRFRLALIRYPGCLVVDELPLQSLQGFSPTHQALLERILASVGLATGEPQVQAFAWPIVSAPHVDQSEAVARGGLKTVIWRLQQGATLPLLLLGEQSARFMLEAGKPLAPGTWLEGEGAPWALVSHSLNELLKVPGRKRELWDHLRPLRR